jgi:hypothetical protein
MAEQEIEIHDSAPHSSLTSFGYPVLGQAVVPQTPAGRVFTAWLAAFNSADPAQIRAFEQSHRRDPRPLEETLG